MADERRRRVLIDLVALLSGSSNHRALLHYLDRDGVELIVFSGLSRQRTRRVLREQRLLRYLDDILYDGDPMPPDALFVDRPADCTYSYIAERCIREDRRPFPLDLDAF